MEHSKISLTSSEIAAIWTAYMNDSMAVCVLSHMIKYMEDEDLKGPVQTSLNMAKKHVEELKQYFQKENLATPVGFTEDDVDLDAPQLSTDTFGLTYVTQMARVGMVAYSGYVSMSVRADIRNHFIEGLRETSLLYDEAIQVALEKGILGRAPYIETTKEIDFIDNKSYLSGLGIFKQKRPLNAVEISHLYLNSMTNSVGVKLCIAFAQTTNNPEVRDYMLKGKEIAKKHLKKFAETLLDGDIETPHLPDYAIMNSTTPTFSDKLLMFQMSLLSAAGIGNYSTAASASQRSDLVLSYEKLSMEIALFAKKGLDIMIKNNWLEQPPGTLDRNKISKKSTNQPSN